MEKLLIESQEKVRKINLTFKRYLYNKINWNNRLIAIKGARGSGKTTIMLQYIRENLPADQSVLYIPLDHIYFYSNSLMGLVERFVLNGGRHLFLDEIHKYPNWSRELKLIYDRYDELRVVFSSSSILEIFKGESDLSRRVIPYNLHELSFREFIELESQIKLPIAPLDEIISKQAAVIDEIISKVKPIFELGKFMKYGAYPFFIEGIDEYDKRLKNVVNMIIENDLPSAYTIDFKQITKLKKLLYAVSTSVPFKPNISKLSEKIEVTRPTLLRFLDYLDKARLIIQLHSQAKGMSAMNKPEKIYLQNTNLIHHISQDNSNIGNIRETFFLNQISEMHKVSYTNHGDFFVDDKYTFEIGGKGKSQKQISGVENAFIVKDDIETGIMNIIPLWLFGFLF